MCSNWFIIINVFILFFWINYKLTKMNFMLGTVLLFGTLLVTSRCETKEKLFSRNSGFRIKEPLTFREAVVFNMEDCVVYCMQTPLCVSANYKPDSNVCELSRIHPNDPSFELRTRPNWSYIFWDFILRKVYRIQNVWLSNWKYFFLPLFCFLYNKWICVLGNVRTVYLNIFNFSKSFV